MSRAKLILICQSLGEFITNDDGTLSYNGGEAHAVDITRETLFDDLKLKLAEMWNLECESLSIKYFLPGNRRTLITLANDKDLKRMYDFHGNSVTADVFIQGRAGFNREALNLRKRASWLKVAEAVMPIAACMSASPSDAIAAPSVAKRSTSAAADANLTVDSESDFATSDASLSHSILTPGSASSTPPGSLAVISDANANNSTTVDMDATPADTVKKRRRAASMKSGAKGSTTVAIAKSNDVGEKTKTTPRRKKKSKHITEAVVDDVALEDKSNAVGEKTKTMPRRKKKSKRITEAVAVADDVEQKEDDSSGISILGAPPEKLMELWKDGITGVGQKFKSVYEFREALQRYAIAHRFTYRLKKNDTNRASGKCIAEGCSWKIYASWDSSTQSFRIKTLNNTHTCGGESWKSAHPAKNWVVSVIKDKLQGSPHHKPKEIAKSILRDFGVKLNYTQVWRGIGDAREQLQGSYKEAYNQLPWFCEKMGEANPGSLIKLFSNEDKRFERLFISFHASIHGFQIGCRPIIFLDATSLKSKFHEILLTATALDGDDGIFPVAFAVVDTENNDNWHWFLEQLRSALITKQAITFVSDREKGLKNPVLEVFENANHGYSIYHLIENFKRSSKGPFYGDGKSSLPIHFLAAAHAVRLDAFKMYTEQIKRVSPQAYDWLMEVEPEYWTSASFKGEPYNHVTVNVAESYAKWIEEVRESPIIRKIEVLRAKTTDLITTRITDSSEWTAKLTPSKEQKLREQRNKAYGFKVLFSSETLFEVHGDSTHVVDIDKRSCSCLGWKPTGLPCSHAIAVFACTGRNVYDYCSRYFTVDSFRLTYSESINPVLANFKPLTNETTDSEVTLILPPLISRPPVEKKEKQSETENKEKQIKTEDNEKQSETENKEKQSETEGVAKRARTVTCTRCKETGHNKATCMAN